MGKIALLKKITTGLFALYISLKGTLDPTLSRYNIKQSDNSNLVLEEVKIGDKNSRIYALLINSGNNDFFHNFSGEIDSIYQSLTKAGVSTDNIYIIDPENTQREGHNFSLNESELKHSIEDLSSKIDGDDHFVFYLTNHAGKSKKDYNGEAYVTMDHDITESNLEERFKTIKPKSSLMAFATCYSGAFADRFGKGNTIAMSNTTADKVSLGYGISPLAERLFPALLNLDSNNKADSNNDGKISVEEAFINSTDSLFNHPLFPMRNVYQLRYGNIKPSDMFYSSPKR